jgi:uncharacterized membrane protein
MKQPYIREVKLAGHHKRLFVDFRSSFTGKPSEGFEDCVSFQFNIYGTSDGRPIDGGAIDEGWWCVPLDELKRIVAEAEQYRIEGPAETGVIL